MTARPIASSAKSRRAGLTVRFMSMCTLCAERKIMRSACARPHLGSAAVMPKKAELLTAKDRREIAQRRAQARLWARRFLEEQTDEGDAALIAAAESDPDNPPLTDDQLRRMRP